MDYKIHHAMAVTRDELRKELKDEFSPIRKELTSLTNRVVELEKSVIQLPTKQDLRELVDDKIKAMKGGLIVWILSTAIGIVLALTGILAGILKFVPSLGS